MKIHLSESPFNKVPGWRPATLLRKRFRLRFFPVNFARSLRTPAGDCFCVSEFDY